MMMSAETRATRASGRPEGTLQPARIAVFGSLNVDLVTRLRRFPAPGETVAARSFAIYPGGKGANQAVACGRLGADVAMFGALGNDVLAPRLRDSLDAAHVRLDAVAALDDVATGTADIWVDDRGENMIAIAEGANGRVDEAYVDDHVGALAAAEYLLLQLEVPIRALAHLLSALPAAGGPRVILDPAPALPLAELPLERVWLLTPNEHELATLTGLPTDSESEVRAAAARLAATTGVRAVLIKAGGRGAFLSEAGRFERLPGFPVRAVDTTAAGDAFNGALAAALAGAVGEPLDFEDAVRFAHAAAALQVTRPGAQPALPERGEVVGFLREHSAA